MKSLSILILVFTFSKSLALNNGVISYGGDAVIQKTYEMMYSLAEKVNRYDSLLLPWEDLATKLQSQIPNIKITYSNERLFLNEKEVMAINYPTATPVLLVVSVPRWNEIYQTNPVDVEKVILHELMHLQGFLDIDYRFSLQIWSLFNYNPLSIDLIQFTLLRNDKAYLAHWEKVSEELYARYRYDTEFLLALLENLKSVQLSEIQTWKKINQNYIRSLPDFTCDNITFRSAVKRLKVAGSIGQQLFPLYDSYFLNTCGQRL